MSNHEGIYSGTVTAPCHDEAANEALTHVHMQLEPLRQRIPKLLSVFVLVAKTIGPPF